jgi:hypothetical protein
MGEVIHKKFRVATRGIEEWKGFGVDGAGNVGNFPPNTEGKPAGEGGKKEEKEQGGTA